MEIICQWQGEVTRLEGAMQVWEVTAQLVGLAGSVGLLKAIEATGKPENVLYVWAVNQVLPLHDGFPWFV